MTDSDGTAAWGALSRIGRDTGRSGWTAGGAVRFLAGTGAVVGESISSAGAWRNGRTKSSCSFLGATVWASRDGTCSEGAGTSTVVSWSITSIRGAASTMGSVGFWCACGADCRVGKTGCTTGRATLSAKGISRTRGAIGGATSCAAWAGCITGSGLFDSGTRGGWGTTGSLISSPHAEGVVNANGIASGGSATRATMRSNKVLPADDGVIRLPFPDTRAGGQGSLQECPPPAIHTQRPADARRPTDGALHRQSHAPGNSRYRVPPARDARMRRRSNRAASRKAGPLPPHVPTPLGANRDPAPRGRPRSAATILLPTGPLTGRPPWAIAFRADARPHQCATEPQAQGEPLRSSRSQT